MRYLFITLTAFALSGCQGDHDKHPKRPSDDNNPPGRRPVERNVQPEAGQPLPTNDANPNQRTY